MRYTLKGQTTEWSNHDDISGFPMMVVPQANHVAGSNNRRQLRNAIKNH
jgi:hypothetical protein